MTQIFTEEKSEILERIRSFLGWRTALIVHSFKILRDGWELDNDGWVVQYENGDYIAITTDHGGICHLHQKELEEIIQETQKSLTGLLKAQSILATHKK